MARVTGSVFFKSRNDNAALAAWYQKHLGMRLESFSGAVLKWPDDSLSDTLLRSGRLENFAGAAPR